MKKGAFKSCGVHDGGCYGRRPVKECWCTSWLLLVLENFDEPRGSELTAVGSFESRPEYLDVETEFYQSSGKIFNLSSGICLFGEVEGDCKACRPQFCSTSVLCRSTENGRGCCG